MCGIFGLVIDHEEHRANIRSIADGFVKSLHHRGPDDFGYEIITADKKQHDQFYSGAIENPQILIGQTRLSIIDLSLAGHQPMWSNDGRYSIVYSGEIYNYTEIRDELSKMGITFHSRTDTEVLVEAFAVWGKAVLKRLTGMYAFCIYDKGKNTVFCARDIFGIKPFYYSTEHGFCFSSEIGALLTLPGIGRDLNHQRAYQYLLNGMTDYGCDTLIEQVKSLPPAHSIEVDANTGKVRNIEKYWEPDLTKRLDISFEDAAAELRAKFLGSVRAHLMSDVQVGIALSGGIDSSSIACAIRYIEPDFPIQTFSYVADGPILSEEKWVDQINHHVKATSFKTRVNQDDLLMELDDLILSQGEPFNSTSIFVQRKVFELARQNGIVVGLDGQGADELMAGYDGHSSQRIHTLLKENQYLGALRFYLQTIRWPGRSKKKIVMDVLNQVAHDNFGFLVRRFTHLESPPWMNKAFHQTNGTIFESEWIPGSLNCPFKVREFLAFELTHRLPTLLRYEDRNSMRFSIESRVPYLTREMAEYTLSLPEEYLVDPSGRTKSVFREAMKGIVPDAILNRRDKIGFLTPESEWLKSVDGWITETLSKSVLKNVFNKDSLLKSYDSMKQGKKPFDTLQIWRWVNFIRWAELYSIND